MEKTVLNKSFAIALCLVLWMVSAMTAAASGETVKAAEGEHPASQISIRSEGEPRLQAPLRTLISTAPQVYLINFPEPMNRESVLLAIRKQAVSSEALQAPELVWDFKWENDRSLTASVAIKALHPRSGFYLHGDYRIDVNGSLTSRGKLIVDAPVFAASIQTPSQLWRYSLQEDRGELIASIDEPYSFRKLDYDERYWLGTRPVEYCECDAVLKKLYALYDLEEKRLLRYPVELQTAYKGKGSFVADRRGFFYEQPEDGIQVSLSDSSAPIHVEGYVHGAGLSKDGNYVFMAVGEETQEKDLSIMRYSLDSNTVEVLAASLAGSVPNDQAFGRRMPVHFHDDGEHVLFVLHQGDSYREIRYEYSWNDGQIRKIRLPVADDSWYGFTSSGDRQFRHYANGGLYYGDKQVAPADHLPFWSEHWVRGTHHIAYYDSEIDQTGQKQYTGRIRIFNADTLKETTLYYGLYTFSNMLGTSSDSQWVYVNTWEPVHTTSQFPLFGEEDGKLLARISPNNNTPVVLYMDDMKLKLEHEPVIVDHNSLFIPLREVLEAAGWTITWHAENKTVRGEKNGRSDRQFTFNIGSATAKFNLNEINLLLAPRLVGDTAYVYAGMLQKLGMKLEWDNSKRVLFIRQTPESGGIVMPDGSKYEGGLKDDSPSGSGMLFDKTGRLIYEGEFKEGKFHGQGKRYNGEGRLEYSGVFQNGARRD